MLPDNICRRRGFFNNQRLAFVCQVRLQKFEFALENIQSSSTKQDKSNRFEHRFSIVLNELEGCLLSLECDEGCPSELFSLF